MLSPAETVDTKQLPMEDKEANMLEEPPMDTPPPPMKDMAMEVMFNQAMANQAMVNQAMVKQQPMVVNTKLEAATFMLTHNNINLILWTLPSTLANKSSREKAESSTFLSRKRSLNTRMKLELKEYPELEKSQNIEKKRESKKFLEKLPSPTTMPSNILDNTSPNISQKKKSNMLPRNVKLKDTNTSQSKGKLFTTLNNLSKLNSAANKDMLVELLEPAKLDMLIPLNPTINNPSLPATPPPPILEDKPAEDTPPETADMPPDYKLLVNMWLEDTLPEDTLLEDTLTADTEVTLDTDKKPWLTQPPTNLLLTLQVDQEPEDQEPTMEKMLHIPLTMPLKEMDAEMTLIELML